MRFPKLKQPSVRRQALEAFGGYNHNLRIGDGEFFNMENMTSDLYPLLAPRGVRGIMDYAADVASVTGMTVNHGICIAQGQQFLLPDGRVVDLALNAEEKRMVSMGAYVIILPDKKWVNVAACVAAEEIPATAYGNMEATWLPQSTTQVTYCICKADGTELDNAQIPVEKPADPEDGELWCDESKIPAVLNRWDEDTARWVEEENVYLKIAAQGITAPFSKGDCVKITGVDVTSTSGGVSAPVVYNISQISEIVACGVPLQEGDAEYLVVPGFTVRRCTVSAGAMQIRRSIPDMDYVIECGNRLWGCKYGITDDGPVNEIYCSKLGDFKNWYSFQGTATDSYMASIGTDGPFTGAVSYQGRPMFFKENCLIEVYGNYPANYRVQTTPCEGVQDGCAKSIALANNILFYKSRGGVCSFDGSLPVQIGDPLGTVAYEQAVAGSCGGKYYISMLRAGSDAWSLFVYDAVKGLWHREDALHARLFCAYQNELYCVPEGGTHIVTMLGSGLPGESRVLWMVETGDMGLSMPDMKYISRLNLRFSLEEGADVTISAAYDGSDVWEHLYSAGSTHLRSFTIPIRPKRCDHMRLKLEGTGPVKLYSITKSVEQGSDIL